MAIRNLHLQVLILSRNKAPVVAHLLAVKPNRPRQATLQVKAQEANLALLRVKKVNNGYQNEENIIITHDRHS